MQKRRLHHLLHHEEMLQHVTVTPFIALLGTERGSLRSNTTEDDHVVHLKPLVGQSTERPVDYDGWSMQEWE